MPNLADEQQFSMVYVAGSRYPRFKHPVLKDATAEAERLSKLNPGRRVYVLRPVASTIEQVPELSGTVSK